MTDDKHAWQYINVVAMLCRTKFYSHVLSNDLARNRKIVMYAHPSRRKTEVMYAESVAPVNASSSSGRRKPQSMQKAYRGPEVAFPVARALKTGKAGIGRTILCKRIFTFARGSTIAGHLRKRLKSALVRFGRSKCV